MRFHFPPHDRLKDFIKDPQVQLKKDMLDRCNREPYSYQPKKVYDTLIQIVILKKTKIVMGITTVDIDIELKMKISRRKNLESRLI